MTLQDSITTAFKGLESAKSRSALTILGIVIGISAIILMMALGSGAESLILNQIGGLGAETIVIRPGKEPSGPSDFGSTLFANSLKNRDVEALRRKENAPHLVQVMPALIVPGTVSYEGETFQPMTIGGVVDFFSSAFQVYVAEGIPFSDIDIRQNASVAVIGSKVKQELFGPSDALGEQITIKGRKFRVVGIFPPKGQVGFFNFDELVIVPYTTAQLYLLGIDYFHEIIVKTESPETVARSVDDIEATLRETHNITNPKDDDFFVVTQQAIAQQVQIIIGALTLFLSSVVAIALVVGGIGVMNIMLVSVTERTREIGLRKALGATQKDILVQFLLEAIILTGVGGLIGIALGGTLALAASFLIRQILSMDWAFAFPISAVFLGLGVSALVGLVFGIYPARQASKKSPIEALRYE
ncbi:MAG: ABC transporter permease [Candidatus Wildermuthbacteria bacterium]|nr:ABC transporter permease [Candidatus Wildermuthbacteria bacterium]